jgi:peptidyl-prolyl cis-trans isomerase SurA
MISCSCITYATDAQIVAIVNKDLITKSQLEKRVTLLVAMGIVQLDQENRHEIYNKVLKSLIDENIFAQNAKELSISVNPKIIDDEVKEIEKQNSMPHGSLSEYLRERGSSIEDFKERIKNDILVRYIASSVFGHDTKITKRDIEHAIEYSTQKDAMLSLRRFEIDAKIANGDVKLSELRSRLKGCNVDIKLSNKDLIQMSHAYESVSAMRPHIRHAVKNLKDNQVSAIISDGEKLVIYQMCKRSTLNLSDDENAHITQYITNKKITQQFQRYSESLRKSAYIKVNQGYTY